MLHLARKGVSYNEIARLYGVSATIVRRAAREAGIAPRPPGRRCYRHADPETLRVHP